MLKEKLVSYLDNYLKIDQITDSSKNWLQVDNSKKQIKKIWYAVDATNYILDLAVENKVDFLIVHHWLFWWVEQVLVWVSFERIKKLIKHNIALYASHLPLDKHEEVGNNIGIVKWFANIFWIQNYDLEELWNYNQVNIWYGIKYTNPIHISNIITPFATSMWFEKKLYNFWQKEYIKNIFVVSWGWWEALLECKQKNYDLFITGEMAHWQLCLAKELWQSLLLWWHRETEKIGVKLLAHHLQNKFSVDTIFLDEKY